MKIKLLYVGKHQPNSEIEVEEKDAEALVEQGGYIRLDGKVKTTIEVKEIGKDIPDKKWTEKKIKEWIEANNIPIDYDIANDTKKEILEKLKEHL